MTVVLLWAWCSAWCADASVATGDTEGLRRGIQACEVLVPQGEYAAVHLEFSLPDERGKTTPWTHTGGMRAGRIRLDDGIGLREPGGWLEYVNDCLRGTFRYVPGGDRTYPPPFSRCACPLRSVFATFFPMKTLLQAGLSGHVPAPAEKQFLVSYTPT
jgi:hypothetical protein